MLASPRARVPWAGRTPRYVSTRLLHTIWKLTRYLPLQLYSDAFADVFHDITDGDNFACGPNGELGFVTAPGWDPVTGLGTPDFGKLLDAWMALP